MEDKNQLVNEEKSTVASDVVETKPTLGLDAAPSLRVELPPTPVDGFEVRYFTIRGEYLQGIRLKYHVNSKWSDVCPDSDSRGASLIDQWQVFTDGRFSGRMDGWRTPAILDHRFEFARRADAVSALKHKFEQRAEQADKEACRYRKKAAALALANGQAANTRGSVSGTADQGSVKE